MEIYIDNYDYWNMPAEKYWKLPKNKDPKVEIKKAVFNGEYFAARKIDGNWGMVIKDMEGNLHMRGRSESVNGGYTDKMDWIPYVSKELEYLPNGTVLVGEIFLPKNERSRAVTTIMGCLLEKSLKRQENEDNRIHFYVFDCLAYAGENIMNEPIYLRVNHYLYQELVDILTGQYVCLAIYYEGQELWDYIAKVLAAGGEGVVLQSKNTPYEPNKRKAWKTIKVKKEIENEIDLFITGKWVPSTHLYTGKEIKEWTFWEHSRTGEKMNGHFYQDYKEGATIVPVTKGWFYGWAGSIQLGAINEKGEEVEIAWISNVTEDVKKRVVTGKLNHQVVKVQAMEIEKDTGRLRHGKIIEFRNDISYKDCTTDKIYN